MLDLAGFHASLVFHVVLLLLLAFLTLDPVDQSVVPTLLVAPKNRDDDLDLLLDSPMDSPRSEEAILDPVTVDNTTISAPNPLTVHSPLTAATIGASARRPGLQAEDLPVSDLLVVSEAPTGGGVEGRTPRDRARLVASRGGNAASENAVELGLAWLAAHQCQDGSWQLDHTTGPCDGRCANPGSTSETRIGATGLALLAMLGAGYSHMQGKYQDVVGNGLRFLQNQMKTTNFGGDLAWDSASAGMYAHGIATLAFCEAYAMTGEEGLLPFAQSAVEFICSAQGPRGGWRYRPGQPGDTTVTGWQVMALKSARLAHLFVPLDTTENAKLFLNSVQDGNGAFYGYMNPVKEPGPTAVGLLLRMYLGWSRQDERLQRGVNYLAHRGPSTSDMYFNYYATQVLHHYGGQTWDPWNVTMRDFLIASQASMGHERGSWFFADPHGSVGGRHYTTAICTMTLEVYYRYMPLYGEDAVEEGL
jgi:hypothetical protein